jgi:hypothetical protein
MRRIRIWDSKHGTESHEQAASVENRDAASTRGLTAIQNINGSFHSRWRVTELVRYGLSSHLRM